MFIPKSFKETDLNTIKDFITGNPLATVIAQTEHGLEASYIPMYWQDDGTEHGCLMGHIAKVNPLNNESNLTQPWLIIFQDAGHYISPNWYASKAVTHKAVPTWNYRSVHIKGKTSLLTKPEELIAILTWQTADFEATQPIPWSLKDAPETYINGLCRAIVGIKIDICDIQAQFKLSQNKIDTDRQGVVVGLKKMGTTKADAMAGLIDI